MRAAYLDPDHINTDKDFLVVTPPEMPGGFYDYIANLPSGSREGLQAMAGQKFNLTGRFETRELDVLLLKVNRPNAPGLNPSTNASTQMELTKIRNGMSLYRNRSMSDLASVLESSLRFPVVDQTGMNGRFNFDLPTEGLDNPDARLKKIRPYLFEQLGLTLEPGRQLHEVFVIEKTAP